MVCWLTICAAWPGAGVAGEAARPVLVVIAHPGTPVRALDRDALGAFFLRKQILWSDSQRVVAFNAPTGSATRAAFDEAPLCAKMPGASSGYCTVNNCDPKHDACPTGDAGFDLSVFGVSGVSPFCSKQ